MSNQTYINEYIQELAAEATATRKCLERIPESLYNWKPHEKSMDMGYLTLLVADIPRWITYTIEKGEVDFATYPQFKLSDTAALVAHFDKNMEDVKKALESISDEALSGTFFLKNGGQVLFSASKKDTIGSSINHMVHHRGQLTVYMRLNDIAVPSIYGPSADDKGF
jgi:uncharacterized damage-inducible protein DinB